MERLAKTSFIKDFYLAGGTALALIIGHRQSIDFDFFSYDKFSPIKVLDNLQEILNKDEIIEVKEQDEGTLIVFVNNVKISFFYYNHKLLDSKINAMQNISLASLKDIFAMKLIAISQRGTKKDFIDLYFLLKEKFTISDAVDVLNQKYEKVKFNKLHILKSLTYFNDANLDPDPIMLKDISWKDIKEKIGSETEGFLKKLVK